MGDDTYCILDQGLWNSNPALRAAAVRLRRSLTTDEMQAVLTDSDPEVRAAALWHLHVPLTPKQLERALLDPEPGVRIRAIFRPEPLSPGQIRRALDDRSPLVARAAAVKLRRGR